MTTEKRVRTRASHEHTCEDDGYDCDGIQRWVRNPYYIEVYGRSEYNWYCKGVLALLEDDV